MTTFLKSQVQNIYSSSPCRCIGIYFGDYSNPFEEAAEESMVMVTHSRRQLQHYGDPFKKQWRYYNNPFKKQQRQNLIVIIVQNMIQLVGRPFLNVSGGIAATLHKTSGGKISFLQFYLD